MVRERKKRYEKLLGVTEHFDREIKKVRPSKKALSDIFDELYTAATRDQLTGVLSRRALDELLSREMLRAIRYNQPLSAIMLDIDNFKSYNDRYGHVQGDLALKAVTATVEKATRAEDFVARYGGEEFIVILPNATSARARKIAERIRQKVARIRVKASRKNLPRGFEKITISLGIAQLPKDGQRAIRAMLTRADQALYEAKKRGKNQVCIK